MGETAETVSVSEFALAPEVAAEAASRLRESTDKEAVVVGLDEPVTVRVTGMVVGGPATASSSQPVVPLAL